MSNPSGSLDQFEEAYKPTFTFYDENHWYLTKYVALMRDSILMKGQRTVLSLGIGHQVVADGLLELLHSGNLSSYSIVEGSQAILEGFRTKNSHKGLHLYEAYFEQFESDTMFDAIEMGFVLEHVDDPAIVVAHMKKLLLPNGTLYVAVPNARSLHRMIGHHAGLLPDMYVLSKADLALGHLRYFDLDSIVALMEHGGFSVRCKKGLMLKPITGNQIKELNWGPDIIEALMTIGESYPEMANCIYLECAHA
jgi:SAM-dependent methyltransferase